MIGVHVGQAGAGAGDAMWELLRREHGIMNSGYLMHGAYAGDTAAIRTMFQPLTPERYFCRAVFLDTDPKAIGKNDSIPTYEFCTLTTDLPMIEIGSIILPSHFTVYTIFHRYDSYRPGRPALSKPINGEQYRTSQWSVLSRQKYGRSLRRTSCY